MWVITTDGFLSAVEHRGDPDKIMVRARVKADLERVRAATGLGFRIKRSQQWADYAYRTTMSRADWVQVCATLAGEVDYDNFKNAVAARRGKERAGVYMSVWGALLRLQPVKRVKLPSFSSSFVERSPEESCKECGTFLLRHEREEHGGQGVCDLCEREDYR